ncbi:IS256 family transposase [Streptomyces olivoreticuli]|uniref:IS256 family transposase n=1 Tax=Streptomyces olivoreticuli TaxID=68246 RepID=UPI00265A4915|nr:IS256 family transposase [Streptomyces olivoreticuli]WKK27747.1 IS256 family transposase [Streptomyces olivoreticuli]
MDSADAAGAPLAGEGGLLQQLSKALLERALQTEMSEHLGYEKGDPAGRGSGSSRNGTATKTVLTDVGALEVDVPRDRNGDFEPQIVPKNARRLSGFDEQVLSLYARGMSVRDIRSHLAKMYGTEVSPDLISKVTDAVNEEITAWQSRPLDSLWPVVYIDALWIKVRDGKVANRPVYLAVGVDLDGCKHVLGLWIGKDGEGARQWLTILGELKARGVGDVLVACCDGLPGLPDAINAVWPRTTVQTCVIHLVRSSLRYASKADHGKLVPALRKIYTAPTEQAAEQEMEEFTASDLGRKYPAVVRTWSQAWQDFVPYLAFPPEIRKVIYSTNMIESINARLRKVTRNRGHFSTEQAAVKVLYLAIRELIEPKTRSKTHVAPHWKAALNAFSIYFQDRITLN